jgi:hypothetical protein
MPKKVLRRHRLQVALSQLQTLKDELAFEKIFVVLSDNDRHWQFFYGTKYLASYWPASSRGQIAGHAGSIACISVSRARKMAIGAKNHLFAAMSQAMDARTTI